MGFVSWVNVMRLAKLMPVNIMVGCELMNTEIALNLCLLMRVIMIRLSRVSIVVPVLFLVWLVLHITMNVMFFTTWVLVLKWRRFMAQVRHGEAGMFLYSMVNMLMSHIELHLFMIIKVLCAHHSRMAVMNGLCLHRFVLIRIVPRKVFWLVMSLRRVSVVMRVSVVKSPMHRVLMEMNRLNILLVIELMVQATMCRMIRRYV